MQFTLSESEEPLPLEVKTEQLEIFTSVSLRTQSPLPIIIVSDKTKSFETTFKNKKITLLTLKLKTDSILIILIYH